MAINRLLWSTIAVILSGCNSGANGNRDRNLPEPLESIHQTYHGAYPIHIVCTTGMVADMVQNIGSNRVKVHQLIPGDPHLFKASLEDIELLRKADAIFFSGLHLEGKMADVLETLAKRRPTVAVADFLDRGKILKDENNVADPHIWFDVSLWSQAPPGVGKALAKFDPAHAGEYTKRAQEYCDGLQRLDAETKTAIASIPPKQRVLVTSHDAFRYFGRAYEIEVKSIQGISTEAEASVQDINELVEFICQRSIKAVFVETSVNERNMEAVLDGCRARGHRVAKGGILYSDAMGKAGTRDGTYEGMVRHNVDTIVKALK